MDQHYILRLDIAMEYLMAMHQVDRLEEVANDVRGALFGEGFATRDDVVELAVAA